MDFGCEPDRYHRKIAELVRFPPFLLTLPTLGVQEVPVDSVCLNERPTSGASRLVTRQSGRVEAVAGSVEATGCGEQGAWRRCVAAASAQWCGGRGSI
jgi:hypothetical protein